jgi:predicted DNA-binding transcriptional regulator AlpA
LKGKPVPVEIANKLSLSIVEPLLVDAKAAAKLLGISPRHLLGMHSSGRLPLPVRLGRRRLWRVAELTAWVAADCPVREKWISDSHG